MPRAKAIALLGSASDVGKSVLATALCRHLSDRGHDVAPFKAQNMSNNSGVTREGLEMGRAQIVQALAARAEPHVDMNPVLLKPSAEQQTHVVVLGRPWAGRRAEELPAAAFAALERLRQRFGTLVIEGAGSCAEVNLRQRDFVNFRTAHAADAAVVLVADIDRGGVFAQIVGTLDLLVPEDRARVRGVLINRFRGDVARFDDGVRWLEGRTGLPILGVVPHLPRLEIDAEDAAALDRRPRPVTDRQTDDPTAWIAVVHLPHVSNFTDLDPLTRHPRATVHFHADPCDLSHYDLVVLPGSKAVREDLAWLRRSGWIERLTRHREDGGRIAGLCGGYQMLGETIADPDGVEGAPGRSSGLGLLPVHTVFGREKIVRQGAGRWLSNGERVAGYEIHLGRTERHGGAPAAALHAADAPGGDTHEDGCVSDDGRVFGTYLHGLFDQAAFTDALLSELGARPAAAEARGDDQLGAYDRLAAHLRRHVDVATIESWV